MGVACRGSCAVREGLHKVDRVLKGRGSMHTGSRQPASSSGSATTTAPAHSPRAQAEGAGAGPLVQPAQGVLKLVPRCSRAQTGGCAG